MNHKFNLKNTRNLAFQRNLLLGLTSLLLIIILLQTVLLFFKNDKIIITPPELKQSYWVQGERFSDNYLEEMAIFFSHLLLDVSDRNCAYNGNVLLRYVEPSQVSNFKLLINDSLKTLTKNSSSTTFSITNCEVFGSDMQVRLHGILHTYVGGKRITSNEASYEMQLMGSVGKLFITGFKPINKNQEKEER